MATDPNDLANVDLYAFLQAKQGGYDAYDRAAIAAAQEAADDECEVDDVTITSRGDDEQGCFVLAWVWVSRDDMALGEPLDEEDEEEEEAE